MPVSMRYLNDTLDSPPFLVAVGLDLTLKTRTNEVSACPFSFGQARYDRCFQRGYLQSNSGNEVIQTTN